MSRPHPCQCRKVFLFFIRVSQWTPHPVSQMRPFHGEKVSSNLPQLPSDHHQLNPCRQVQGTPRLGRTQQQVIHRRHGLLPRSLPKRQPLHYVCLSCRHQFHPCLSVPITQRPPLHCCPQQHQVLTQVQRTHR